MTYDRPYTPTEWAAIQEDILALQALLAAIQVLRQDITSTIGTKG